MLPQKKKKKLYIPYMDPMGYNNIIILEAKPVMDTILQNRHGMMDLLWTPRSWLMGWCLGESHITNEKKPVIYDMFEFMNHYINQ